MKKEEALAFLYSHPVFHLATVEGDKPHVRSMTMYRINENGILFYTDKSRPVCDQLSANSQVELCFCSAQGDFEIRVNGIAEYVNDMELKKAIDPKQPEKLAVYRIKSAMATLWTMFSDHRTKSPVEL